MTEFDGVILDIDGTLWNTTGIVSTAWNKAISAYNPDFAKINAQILQKEFGKPMDVIAEDLWPQLTRQQRDDLMAECCIEEQIALNNNTMNISYEGVVETIRELSQNVNFYIVSNCQNGYIELTMDKLGIKDCIKDYECYGRIKKAKSENIQIVCARNLLKKPVYVGDTEGDSLSCIQAKIPFIWASYGFGTASTYIEKLQKFSDLKRIIGGEE